MRSVSLIAAFSCALFLSAAGAHAADDGRPPEARYDTSGKATRDGIGKRYFGREIAQVMGHQGAGWLERPERQEEERTDLLLKELALRPGEHVADIGAGSGYFSWRMAKIVGEAGRVYATDIQQEMLDILMRQMRKQGADKIVQPILGTVRDCGLRAASVDTIILVDVYHECDFPYEMARSMVAALKPGGRLVLVEYRGEDPRVPIKPLHKMTEAQVRKEMAVHPVTFERNIASLPRQHILIFRKNDREQKPSK
ncbi:MAG: class I SAM-dependent methyltransferase [Opitutaceae bacterium]|nr:class I SAM-dependent methyltransferase [Opitutaceae bacterium]